jgi:hypothetical protein
MGPDLCSGFSHLQQETKYNDLPRRKLLDDKRQGGKRVHVYAALKHCRSMKFAKKTSRMRIHRRIGLNDSPARADYFVRPTLNFCRKLAVEIVT